MTGKKKSGLAKAAAILATVFLVSLGLCGVNFVFLKLGSNYPGGLLISTGSIEISGMAISAMGLLVVGTIAIIKRVTNHFSTKHSVSIIEKDEDK